MFVFLRRQNAAQRSLPLFKSLRKSGIKAAGDELFCVAGTVLGMEHGQSHLIFS